MIIRKVIAILLFLRWLNARAINKKISTINPMKSRFKAKSWSMSGMARKFLSKKIRVKLNIGRFLANLYISREKMRMKLAGYKTKIMTPVLMNVAPPFDTSKAVINQAVDLIVFGLQALYEKMAAELFYNYATGAYDQYNTLESNQKAMINFFYPAHEALETLIKTVFISPLRSSLINSLPVYKIDFNNDLHNLFIEHKRLYKKIKYNKMDSTDSPFNRIRR